MVLAKISREFKDSGISSPSIDMYKTSTDPYRSFKSQHRCMSELSLRVIVLPSLVYSVAGFELDSEQDELRKALLIKQETDFDFLLLLVFSNS